jgi:hypothetical protein
MINLNKLSVEIPVQCILVWLDKLVIDPVIREEYEVHAGEGLIQSLAESKWKFLLSLPKLSFLHAVIYFGFYCEGFCQTLAIERESCLELTESYISSINKVSPVYYRFPCVATMDQ